MNLNYFSDIVLATSFASGKNYPISLTQQRGGVFKLTVSGNSQLSQRQKHTVQWHGRRKTVKPLEDRKQGEKRGAGGKNILFQIMPLVIHTQPDPIASQLIQPLNLSMDEPIGECKISMMQSVSTHKTFGEILYINHKFHPSPQNCMLISLCKLHVAHL